MLFNHSITTGSGWVKATLALVDEDSAWIDVDMNWAGTGQKHYRIHFAHEQLTPAYGVLYLVQIERYEPPDSPYAVVETRHLSDLVTKAEFPRYTDDPEMDRQWREMYDHVTYEYIGMLESQPWIADTPSLEDMRLFGYAQWNNMFDLILLLHHSPALTERNLDNKEIESVLLRLDRMKFVIAREE